MLTIRLNRVGKKNQAKYRVVVMDHKRATDARPVEFLGFYNPHNDENPFQVDVERVDYWLSNGAQTSSTVASFLRKLDLKSPILVRKKKNSKQGETAKEESEDTPAEEKSEKPQEDAKVEEKKEEKKDDSAKKEEKSEPKAEKEEAPKKEEKKEAPKPESKEEDKK